MHSYFYGERISPPLGLPPISSTTGSTKYLIAGEQAVDLALSPSSIATNFGDLTIWRVGEGMSRCNARHRCCILLSVHLPPRY